jgi:vancomycin resistance protein VanW
VWLTPDHLAGEWRAARPPERRYEVYEHSHWITREDWGGYVRHNILRRRVFNLGGEPLDDEYVTENHAVMMYQPFLSADGRKLSKQPDSIIKAGKR